MHGFLANRFGKTGNYKLTPSDGFSTFGCRIQDFFSLLSPFKTQRFFLKFNCFASSDDVSSEIIEWIKFQTVYAVMDCAASMDF